MIGKLYLKHFISLSMFIIVLNTQGILPINYYFPGTILCSMALIVYILKNQIELKANLMWIFIPTIVYWLSEKALDVTGLGGSFLTFRFIPLLSLVALGLLINKIVLKKNWKTFLILLAIWLLDIIWTAVAYKQGLNAASRIYQGGSPEDELNIVNRFFLGTVYAIEICSILALVEFTTTKKLHEDNLTS